jgi:TonB family protein
MATPEQRSARILLRQHDTERAAQDSGGGARGGCAMVDGSRIEDTPVAAFCEGELLVTPTNVEFKASSQSRLMRLPCKPATTIAALVASVAAPVSARAVNVTLLAAMPNTVVTGSHDCDRPNVAARIIEPWYPTVARIVQERNVLGDPYGTATVAIDLDSLGVVRATRIVVSSGIQLLDREALVSALLSKYVPELSECTPRSGSYLITVDFDN